MSPGRELPESNRVVEATLRMGQQMNLIEFCCYTVPTHSKPREDFVFYISSLVVGKASHGVMEVEATAGRREVVCKYMSEAGGGVLRTEYTCHC